MKIFSIRKFYFYSIIMIFVSMNSGSIFAQIFPIEGNEKMQDISNALRVICDMRNNNHEHEDVENIIVTLRVIRELHDEIESVSYWFDTNLLMDVTMSLIEMYKKIVEITVMHYLMPGGLSQKEFHDKIIKIISNDITKIIDSLCKKFVAYIFNQDLTWQDRICHCAWILSIILIIKTGIKEIPHFFDFAPAKENIEKKILEITLCLKAKMDDSV